MRFAAIDIGTVTSRLLVADTDGAHVHDVAREYEVTNLGEGVDATGRISEAALERVERAMHRFMAVRDALSTPGQPILATIVMSTSAARDADNAADFAAMLASCGLELQVISGEREAELTFAGVTNEVEAGMPVAIVDVGGGSTEVSFGAAGGGITAARSFDIGCRRMTERFFCDDPPAPSEIETACAWARDQLEEWRASLIEAGVLGAAQDGGASSGAREPIDATCGCTLFAVAGTATSAISMDKGLAVYDSALVHGSSLSLVRLEELARDLAQMPLEMREHVVGLDPRRAPVIVAGLLILICVMRAFGFRTFTASESDILQGMILCAAHDHVRSRQIR